MTNETYLPVITSVGLLKGRDAIYLDSLCLDGADLVLEGELNKRLLTPPTEEWPQYTLRFHVAFAFRVLELDTWEASSYVPILMETSFWEVINSEWQKSLGGNITPDYKHFTLQTYDHVIDVICQKFTYEISPSG